MRVRRPFRAGSFYPASAGECRRQLEACLAGDLPELPAGEVVIGVAVPHAGWVYSGPTAGLAFAAVHRTSSPEVFVLLGASHSPFLTFPAIMSAGEWETPLGRVAIDEDLAEAVLAAGAGRIRDDPEAHEPEHSIEVQVPFVQYLFPEARIVPIIVPPAPDSHLVGDAVADAVEESGLKVAVVGSADLTHYGPHFGLFNHGTGARANAWVRENDRRMVDLLLGMRAEEIVPEANQRQNCCGAGALAALTAACRRLGVENSLLLHQTTSYEVMPDPAGDTIVGYASVAFLKPGG